MISAPPHFLVPIYFILIGGNWIFYYLFFESKFPLGLHIFTVYLHFHVMFGWVVDLCGMRAGGLWVLRKIYFWNFTLTWLFNFMYGGFYVSHPTFLGVFYNIFLSQLFLLYNFYGSETYPKYEPQRDLLASVQHFSSKLFMLFESTLKIYTNSFTFMT